MVDQEEGVPFGSTGLSYEESIALDPDGLSYQRSGPVRVTGCMAPAGGKTRRGDGGIEVREFVMSPWRWGEGGERSSSLSVWLPWVGVFEGCTSWPRRCVVCLDVAMSVSTRRAIVLETRRVASVDGFLARCSNATVTSDTKDDGGFVLDDPVFGRLTFDSEAGSLDGSVELNGRDLDVVVSAVLVEGRPIVSPVVYGSFRGIREDAKRAEVLIREWFAEPDNDWACDEEERPLDPAYIDRALALCVVEFYADGSVTFWYAMDDEFDCLEGHSILVSVAPDRTLEFEGLVG